eukprot:jgi/Bigna1/134244/aug1.24_g8952
MDSYRTGYVSEKSLQCIRKLAYTTETYHHAAAAGHMLRLPGILEEVPRTVHHDVAVWLARDIAGYGYVKDFCEAMEKELKTHAVLATIIQLESRPSSDTLSHQLVNGWLSHLELSEKCASWWKDTLRGLQTVYTDLHISQDPKLRPRPSILRKASSSDNNKKQKQKLQLKRVGVGHEGSQNPSHKEIDNGGQPKTNNRQRKRRQRKSKSKDTGIGSDESNRKRKSRHKREPKVTFLNDLDEGDSKKKAGRSDAIEQIEQQQGVIRRLST